MSHKTCGPEWTQRSITATSLLVVCLCLGMAACTSPAGTHSDARARVPSTTSPTPVREKTAPSPISESGPAGKSGWFLWERANFRKGTQDYLAQNNGGPWIRINAPATFGRQGDVGRGRVVYSQERIHRYQSTQTDIWQYDLRTGHRSRLPRPINTRADEGQPSVSGQYLLFQRLIRPGLYAVDTEKVMLFDRRRQVMKTLAVARRPPRDDFAPSVATGQLNGRYASWLRVVWTEKSLGGGSYYDAPHSLVGLYDVETGNLVTHRLPPSSFVSTSAVSSNGSLYYVQYAVTASADESVTPGCLMKQALGGAPELIAKMPSRHLVSDLYVDDRSDGSHLVYFTVADSEGTAGGNQIFSITDPSPPSSRD
jgi:hypothetical protein